MVKKERKLILDYLQRNVERKIILAEGLLREPHFERAIQAVFKLPDDAEKKPEFLERISLFDEKYEKKILNEKIHYAERQVDFLERFYSEFRVENAKKAIQSLPEIEKKTELIVRYQTIVDCNMKQ